MIPFVGPSYQLNNRKADVQRTVNMYLKKVESGSGKAQYILESVPGLTTFASRTTAGQTTFRGVISTNRYEMYAVLGGGFFSIDASATLQLIGTFAPSAVGTVVMAYGRTHVVFAQNSNAYTYNLATNAFAQITDPDFVSLPAWVCHLAGRYIFGQLDSDEFAWSAQDDPTTYDALDFATAESSPDGIVRGVVYREELWLLGTKSTEVWRASSSADAAFERNSSVSLSVGCNAAATVCALDNSLFWVGQDDNGSAVVYMASGYQPRRVSTHAIEEMLMTSTALSDATAYCYQLNGQAFYCISAPGLSTTLCYEVGTDSWHERADFFNGDFSQSRITHHAVLNNGVHLFCGALSGHPTLSDRAVFYTHDFGTYTLDGDTLCRERTSPHYATASMDRVFYGRLRLDCQVGGVVSSTKYVQLYYSNDGGYTWSNSALSRSLGETGDRRTRVQWNRLGSATDRVFRLRCTDDVQFDIVNVDIQTTPGTS